MSAVVEKSRGSMTLEEFLRLPDGPPHLEFEEGDVIEMPPARPGHQKVVLRLGSVLDAHTQAQKLGEVWPEVGVLVGPARLYIPDLVYLSRERRDLLDADGGIVRGAPDLVVEILSAYGVRRDRLTKLMAYHRAGVTWYWIVDPDELTVEEYRHSAEGYVRTGGADAGEVFRPGLFQGMEIDLKKLVAEGEEKEERGKEKG